MQVLTKNDFSEIIQYNHPDFPIYVRRALLSFYPDFSAIAHWHDDFEFILILSGEMEYNINGSFVTFHAGEGIFVNSRQLHYGFSSEKKECDFICFLLHPLLLSASVYTEKKFILPFLSNPDLPYLLLRPDIHWQNTILHHLKQLYDSLENPLFTLSAQSYFFQIYLELYKHAPRLSEKTEQLTSQYEKLSSLNSMVGYIQKNYNHKVTLLDIATSGHICKSSCSSLFQNKLHCSPISYLNKYRLMKSIELLCYTSMNITEISYEVGFSGASYFTELFHKHFGCTPSQYRKQRTEKL